ncbi:ead/Ea22-like family protein [Klebsiella quasipneumoniae subsp. quasipneumoniae]|uniref:ead/Ea22-like family protein n=1 Tax=Klebsiella quasipneumoniae TaxID=1463165 RepID=UPI00217E3FB0|nr:ead/Ea22-like family protein [Klebsiella quasipneumoniae]MCS5748899.1 ead/Ea22-like family protein [Klebsiella quasipneumoniae subsp. quasipneumoniae]
MTTNITELAQSLKAAAENAIGAHERLAAYPYGEIIDISQHEGEQIDIDITDLNEFNKEANPVNILALVEALEKAQGMEAYWKTQCRGITDHCEELQARIAELESRTVTVKLPESFKLAKSSSGLTYYYADEVDAALTDAGIKVEAE